MQRIILIGLSLFFAVFSVMGVDSHFPSSTDLDISFDVSNANAKPGQKIPVSFILANKESNSLNGFFYSDHVADSVIVETDSVLINGTPVTPSNYTYSVSASGEIYQNCKTHTWILQSPENYGGPNTIASGSTSGKVEIHYSYQVVRAGTYHLEGYSWAGKFGDKGGDSSNTVFGYCDSLSIIVDNTSSFLFPNDIHSHGADGYGIQRISCNKNSVVCFTMKAQNSNMIHFRIYDVSGRILWSRNLSNSEGVYSLTWKPEDQCGKKGGIFFAGMQTQNRRFVKKFTLVR